MAQIFKKPISLSGNALKILAVIAMTTDHIAHVFVPEQTGLWYFMRIIGRMTAPIMCFFIAEGFYHTRDRRQYLKRMAVFAFIAQIPYFYMVYGNVSGGEFIRHLNVMYTFCVTLLMLFLLEIKLKSPLKTVLIVLLFVLADLGDWSFFIPAWTLIFYKYRGNFKKQAILFSVVSVMFVSIFMVVSPLNFYQYSVLLSLIPLSMYSGRRGGYSGDNKVYSFLNKWGFYWYYPLHMAVLYYLGVLL